MKNKKEEQMWPSVIGGSFALLQHGIDRVVEWGFRKLKEVPQKTPGDDAMKSPALRRFAKGARSVLRFFGQTGEAYYRKYEELKKRGTDIDGMNR